MARKTARRKLSYKSIISCGLILLAVCLIHQIYDIYSMNAEMLHPNAINIASTSTVYHLNSARNKTLEDSTKNANNHSHGPYEYTDSAIILAMYQMLYDIDKLFTKYNLEYWVTAGTLLGAVRHRGIIPWDDDIDIDILSEADSDSYADDMLRETQHPLHADFHALGYEIQTMPVQSLGFKILLRNAPRVNALNYSIPFADIYPVHFRSNHMTAHPMKNPWPTRYFYRNEVYPLRRYEFGEISLFGPNHGVPFLQRAYGDDWNVTKYKEFDHRTEKYLSKNKTMRSIARHEFTAALPFGPLRKL